MTQRLAQRIKKLREKMTQLVAPKEELKKDLDGQRSLTDPDARSDQISVDTSMRPCWKTIERQRILWGRRREDRRKAGGRQA
jgi:hypothetical protein